MSSVNQADPGLIEALTDRYEVERELGRGGMATVISRATSSTSAGSHSKCSTRSSAPFWESSGF
jgi:hypothetical protein